MISQRYVTVERVISSDLVLPLRLVLFCRIRHG